MSAVAMYGQQQSASLERRLEQIFKVVEWAIFLGLCFAAYFVMVGVWEHYMSLDANLKRLTESISDAPTMLITFHPTINNANGKEFEFRNDFNLSYSIWGWKHLAGVGNLLLALDNHASCCQQKL